MHGFGYDPIHDEIVVTSPLTQGILIFRGGAKGEEPPIRVIQGPKTQILGSAYGALDRVSVDPVNNEILLPIVPGGTVKEGGILVFDRQANGDVAPLRMIRSAPSGKVSLRFGKTQAVAYDSKREEILVPN